MPVNVYYEKANLFNSYFCQQSQVNDTNTELPICATDYNNSQYTLENIIDTPQNLNTSKASGPDNINPTLLKQATTELSKPLADLFNFFATTVQRSPVMENRKCYSCP